MYPGRSRGYQWHEAGYHGKPIKNIILLYSERKGAEQRQVQRSVEKAVEQERYEWITIRVDENGGVREE